MSYETQETPNSWRVQFEFLHSGEGTIGGESRSQQPGTGETVQQWWTALTLDHRHNCRTVRPWSLEKVLGFSLRHCQMVQFQPTLNLISFQARASPMEIAKAHVPCANHRCFWCKWCRWDCTAIKPTAKMRCVSSFYSEMATWGMWLYPIFGQTPCWVWCCVAESTGLPSQRSHGRDRRVPRQVRSTVNPPGSRTSSAVAGTWANPSQFFRSFAGASSWYLYSEHDFGTRISFWV